MTAEGTGGDLPDLLRALAMGQSTLTQAVAQQATANQNIQQQMELQRKALEESHSRAQAEVAILRDQIARQNEELRRAMESRGRGSLTLRG